MIVIHIGTPKAGSTTIQHFLRDNDDALRDLSIDYPMIGREHVEGHLKHGGLKHEVKSRRRESRRSNNKLEALAEHIGEGQFRTTILSTEGFSQFNERQVIALERALSRTTSDYRIILIIRDLVDAIPSSYAELNKYRFRTDDFDSFFKVRINREDRSQLAIAERWANVFGWDAMAVRLLDPAALIDGDLLADFLASSGLDKDDPQLTALPRPPRANQSPGWRSIEAIRAVFGGRSGLPEDHALIREPLPTRREDRKQFGSIAEAVAHEMGWDKDKGLYMTLAQATACWETFGSTIKLLNENIKQKLPAPAPLEQRGFVERPFLPDVSHIDPGELRTFYDEWGSRLEARRQVR